MQRLTRQQMNIFKKTPIDEATEAVRKLRLKLLEAIAHEESARAHTQALMRVIESYQIEIDRMNEDRTPIKNALSD